MQEPMLFVSSHPITRSIITEGANASVDWGKIKATSLSHAYARQEHIKRHRKGFPSLGEHRAALSVLRVYKSRHRQIASDGSNRRRHRRFKRYQVILGSAAFYLLGDIREVTNEVKAITIRRSYASNFDT